MKQNDKRKQNMAGPDMAASSFGDAGGKGTSDTLQNEDRLEQTETKTEKTDRKGEEKEGLQGSVRKTAAPDTEAASLPCPVIRDLLPVCIDGLASAESQKLVEMHLEECAECRKVCKAMKEPDAPPDEKEAPVVDGLKEIRKRSRRQKNWLWILGICGVLLGMLCHSLIYQAGQVPRMLMDIQVVPETPTQMQVKISSLSPTTGFLWGKSYDEKDGRIAVRVQGGEGILNRTSSLSIPVSSRSPIQTVFCNGSLIWQEETFIEQTTNQLYELKDGYAGDASRAGELMKLLEIALPASGFQLAMNTQDEQHCQWIFALESANPAARWELEQNAYRLRCDAWILMLLTPNLKEVCFTASPLADEDETQEKGEVKKTDNTQKEEEDIRVTRSELEPVLRGKGLPVHIQTPADLQNICNALAEPSL